MQPQSVEPDDILCVVVPPFVVTDFADCLESVIILASDPAVDKQLGDGRRVANAEVGGFEKRTQRSLGPDGCVRTYSRLAATMQQKYCDQGRSTVVSRITWPA